MKSNLSSFLLVCLMELKMALLFARLALFFDFEVIFAGVSGKVIRGGAETCSNKGGEVGGSILAGISLCFELDSSNSTLSSDTF